MIKSTTRRFLLVAAVLLASACATEQPELILSEKSAVELRSIQSRAFETGDKRKIYRAMISTFQDLGYTISKVEPAAGTVSATKLAVLRITATVYPQSEMRSIVRVNAIIRPNFQIVTGHQVDAPEFYQQRFFEPLSKALFLTALQIEDAEVPTKSDLPKGAKASKNDDRKKQ